MDSELRKHFLQTDKAVIRLLAACEAALLRHSTKTSAFKHMNQDMFERILIGAINEYRKANGQDQIDPNRLS